MAPAAPGANATGCPAALTAPEACTTPNPAARASAPSRREARAIALIGDVEESFTVLDGEVEVTFRGQQSVARVGETVNTPANAPHQFHNASRPPARLLCVCAPAGQEEFFRAIGVPVTGPTAPLPAPDPAQQAAFQAEAQALAPTPYDCPRYRAVRRQRVSTGSATCHA
ncbi:MAG TPA: cupin domain-containing protein [Gemmatirosa sp.]